MNETQTIETIIRQATAQRPVTSRTLIDLVYLATYKRITARRVRLIVASLREEKKLPILATKRKPGGYYLASSVAEIDAYETEIRSHALRELATIKNIKADFFGKNQGELTLV